GPIWPGLDFDPDGGVLAFAPATMALNQKPAVLRSVGGATLHITAVGVNPNGSPDFSVVPPMLPRALRPGEALPVEVDYTKSLRTEEGAREVISDAVDAGLRRLRLIPDPAKVCGDGMDNDGDGLTDFPADPGCTSADDNDEYNPPECVNGAVQPC